ncbi:MAG TPA: ChaN family lipoprotein [Pyrinomonadaceae bacterium]|jgi:uncharacterized iron-regulated protein|nr:ChaN family lipoprotein [Pyrinomonadaceae bacterium]
MKYFLCVLTLIILMTLPTFSQTTAAPETFRIFDGQGDPASLEKIIDSLAQADVVFLGEQHDDTVAHKLQLEIFKRAIEKYGAERKLALSMEMFERDVQVEVDEYLKDLISEQHFLSSSRPWGNYKIDYKPLVELAKEKKLPVIAANAPRRYVNMVSRGGRDALNALSPEAKKWLAPLPYAPATEGYRKKFEALMGGSGDANSHGMSKIMDSQSLWDATMADSIAGFLKENKHPLVVQLNGGFHSENRWGIPDHLLKYRPKTRFVVVTIKYEQDFQTFDKSKHTGLGDFVILTDAKQPRSGK